MRKTKTELFSFSRQLRKSLAILVCLLLASAPLMAQNVTIRGTVTDFATGETLIGVAIQVPGTGVGTITNVDGEFQISVPAGSTHLLFTSIGYENVTEAIGTRTVINVRMREEQSVLDELVVVGFGVQRRANLTGAVGSVDVGRQLDGRPLPDVGRGLQGAVAGLSVTAPSGRLGAAPTFRIRGAVGTLVGADPADSNPLILVDGVEIPDINMINPDDIESISVLKDAASSSIFGTRAAFGVILITTRRGQEGNRFTVNYSNNFSWGTPTVLPRMARSYEGAQMALDAHRRRSPGAAFYQFTNNLVVDDASIERMREWERVFGGHNLGPEMIRGRDFEEIGGQVFFYRSFDPVDMFIRNFSPSQQHNLSVSGQTGRTNVRIGIGYMSQGGALELKPNSFDRYSTNMSFDTPVNNWLTARGRFMYSRTVLEEPFNFRHEPNIGIMTQLYRWPAFMPFGTYQGRPFRNQVTETKAANMNTDTRDFMRISMGATAQFTQHFSLDADYTFTTNHRFLHERGGNYSAWDWWATGALMYREGIADPRMDRVFQRFERANHHAANIVLRYGRDFGYHRIGAFTGVNIEQNQMRWMGGERRELFDMSKPEFNLAGGDMFVTGNVLHDWSVFGTFARINYSFADRYLLEVNARYDGSSRFPLGQRFGFFPSVSAGWVFTQESFMEPLQPILSFGQIRASYGSIGNQAVGPNRFRAMMAANQNSGWIIRDRNEPTFGMPTPLSHGFTWETIETVNLGLNLRFFNNQLGLTTDVFQRRNIGMISIMEALPAVFGAAAPYANMGELTTRGWEISTDFRHVFSNGLRFGITANVSDALSTITRHSNGLNTTVGANVNYQGRIFGEIWGFETYGFFTEQDFLHDNDGNRIFFNINEHGDRVYGTTGRFSAMAPGVPCHMRIEQFAPAWFTLGPGDIRYRDLVGDGVIDWGDNTAANPGSMRRIGNTTPRFQYATRINLDYRNFDFQVFFQGVGSRQFWRTGQMLVPGWNEAEMTFYSHQVNNFWTPENPNAHYPRLTPLPATANVFMRGAAMNFMPQTKYLLNMAYLRVKNVTIGYTLPTEWVNRIGIERLRVFASGENLFTFHHLGDLPIDPEAGIDTGDAGIMGFGRTMPFNRIFSFGMQVRL